MARADAALLPPCGRRKPSFALHKLFGGSTQCQRQKTKPTPCYQRRLCVSLCRSGLMPDTDVQRHHSVRDSAFARGYGGTRNPDLQLPLNPGKLTH